MRKFQLSFDQIPVKSEFYLNGNQYFKRSTRTAEIVKPERFAGRWFYFAMNTPCIVPAIERFNTYEIYGIYRVTMNDDFSLTVNAGSQRKAVETVLNSGVVNAPESAVKSCNLVKMI